MRISKYLNTTAKEIAAGKFNVLLGISLGNKYFSKDHIRSYLDWALENSKEKVAVLVPDKIHSINYRVRLGYSEEKAKRLARREAERMISDVKEILSTLSSEKQNKVVIMRWHDIEDDHYVRMLKVLQRAFQRNPRFHDEVIGVVRENLPSEDLTTQDYEKLAAYPLAELPMLIRGVVRDRVLFNLLPYPGTSKIDYLVMDLQEGESFPEITRELKVQSKLRLVEAYV